MYNKQNRKFVNMYGVMIPSHKRVVVGLTYIYGIGTSTSLNICNKLGIPKHTRIGEMSPVLINKLKNYIESNDILIESDLKREKSNFKQRLVSINCYRARRLGKKRNRFNK